MPDDIGLISSSFSALSEVSIKERCQNELRCGHACAGFDGESICAPCLDVSCWDYFVKQRLSDNCVICYSDTLAAAPVIMVGTVELQWLEH